MLTVSNNIAVDRPELQRLLRKMALRINSHEDRIAELESTTKKKTKKRTKK